MKRVPSPTAFLVLTTAVLFGSALGLGVFLFGYAQGTSYLSDNSAACANCHVMQRHLDAWTKSSHGKFTQCNDCHAPHGVVGKYVCKIRNGFFHSLAFTTGEFPHRIIMHDYNRRVVESSCRNCHRDFVHGIDSLSPANGTVQGISCLRCHARVGHDTP
ncbi:MAG: cytochrome c nitrite reductase small subunit [Myxococcales bacterium]|nr:cytochrome c nitrite reductase small subunit [Myxococcales bacterium]